jgi:DNA-binding NarL/FixJ family response regulator
MAHQPAAPGDSGGLRPICDILRLLASGMTNVAIGDRLGLAGGTVRNHVTSIFAKLDVADRAQATAVAWRCGLVSHDSASADG